MKKLLWIIIGIIVGAAARVLAVRPVPQSADPRPVVQLGAIMPLTGGMAKLGAYGNDGAILAIEQINKNPANKNQYVLISEDTAGDVKQAIPIYKKLATIDKVRAIVSFDSGVGQILKPLTVHDRIVHLTPAADESVADGEYNFNNNTDLALGVKKLASYFKHQGYKRIAISGTEYPASVKVLSLLEPELKNQNISVVSKELVAPNQTDVAAQVQKIIKSKPDAIFIYGIEPQLSIFAKTWRQAGYTWPVSGIYTISYSEKPELFDGAVYLDYGGGDEQFRNDFRARFGRSPNAAAAAIFDSVNIIARAFESGDNDIAGAAASYNGINGKHVIKPGGLIHTELVLVEMKNGKPVNLKE